MTETEWVACDRPDDMLQAVRNRIADRKLLLFACGCCRLAGPAFPGGGESVAEMIENMLVAKQEFGRRKTIFEIMGEPFGGTLSSFIAQALSQCGQGSWPMAAQIASMCRIVEAVGKNPGHDSGPVVSHAGQATILRDVLGDPFRPVEFRAEWRTETVIGVATGIESQRAWGRMPILADAIQDAGCEESRVLNHCRSQELHIRGCWVLDLCLGHVL